MQENPNNISCD